MKPEVNAHAMLLRVVAHDLLSPLTAIKWQAELLGHPDTSREKYESYVASIRLTAELGISITKHAHVAGSVLTGTYKREGSSPSISQIISTACIPLKPQFERHGITFDWSIVDFGEMDLDPSLVSLLIWSIAKFFLASVPMNGTVRVTTALATQDDGTVGYEVVCGTNNAVEAEALLQMFHSLTPRNALDQEYVFAFLIHEVARSLEKVSISASYEQGMFAVRALLVAPHA